MSDNTDPYDPAAKYAAWYAAGETRRRNPGRQSVSLPPWEEMVYFDAPTPSVITIPPGGVAVVLCATNPHRVALTLSCIVGGPAFVSINQNESVGNGLQLTNGGVLPYQIDQKTHGNLCQMAWFANATVPTTVYVIEVVLREWRLP